MGKKNRLLFTLVTSFLIITSTIHGQKLPKAKPLLEVIIALQVKFNVRFNYAEESVKDIFIATPPEELTLAQSLEYLEKNTPLSFKIFESQFVIVSSKKSFILCGYLMDKENLSPISSATIQGKTDSAVSDENGFFQISASSETELIVIRHYNYKQISRMYKRFFHSECSPIYLRQNYQILPTVIITDFLTSGINKINNGALEIDFNRFDILPGLTDNDVLQSLQAFPGILSLDETVSNINIRGGTHDQNLILWDEIKMYQSGHFFGLISMYNPQITQKVNVQKNGSNVSYSDGVSGTINMQTQKNLTTKFKGNIGINMLDTNTFLDLPIGKKSSLQIAGRKSISGLLNTPTYNNYFERISQDTEIENNSEEIMNTGEEFDFYDASMRYIYKISPKDELRLNFITVSNKLVFNENELNNNDISRESNISQRSIAGALTYDRIWNDDFRTIFEAYETDYTLRSINSNVLDQQRFLQENIVSETSLKLKSYYRLNDAITFLGGYHFVETKVTNLDDVDAPRYRLLVGDVVRTHGGFAQANYKSEDLNSSLNLGMRYNFIEKFGMHIFEPRLSFSQRFLDYFTLEVLGEFKHQTTSQIINFQNDFLGVEKRRWQLSNNEDIPIIRSKQVSVGLNYSYDGWLASMDGFYKKVDGVTSQSQGFQNQYQFVRTHGNYDVKGIDVLLRKNLDQFNTWVSYSFMDNNYTFSELEANPFPSNYNVSHAMTFGTSYGNENLKISAGLNYHSGKAISQPLEGNEIMDNTINYGPTNSSTLEDYLRLDVSAIYDFKIGTETNARVGISVWNVLNKNNQLNKFYRIKDETIIENTQQSLGLTPNFMMRFYF